MCCIRQIIHKLLASICHMGIFLLFLGLLLEFALSHSSICTNTPPTLPLSDIHTQKHTHTLTVINHFHMCIHLIAPPHPSRLLFVERNQEETLQRENNADSVSGSLDNG